MLLDMERNKKLCLGSSGSLCVLSSSNGRVDLLSILPSDTGRGGTVATTLTRTHTDD